MRCDRNDNNIVLVATESRLSLGDKHPQDSEGHALDDDRTADCPARGVLTKKLDNPMGKDYRRVTVAPKGQKGIAIVFVLVDTEGKKARVGSLEAR